MDQSPIFLNTCVIPPAKKKIAFKKAWVVVLFLTIGQNMLESGGGKVANVREIFPDE